MKGQQKGGIIQVSRKGQGSDHSLHNIIAVLPAARGERQTKGKSMENKVQLMSVNGVKKLNRKTLERNALDILTMGEIAMDFEDALAWVESASKYELIRFLIDNN
mgnify:FL=1